MDAVLFVRTKAVNFDPSLREARPLVEAELREIDADTVGVESAIALDETLRRRQLSNRAMDAVLFVREKL